MTRKRSLVRFQYLPPFLFRRRFGYRRFSVFLCLGPAVLLILDRAWIVCSNSLSWIDFRVRVRLTVLVPTKCWCETFMFRYPVERTQCLPRHLFPKRKNMAYKLVRRVANVNILFSCKKSLYWMYECAKCHQSLYRKGIAKL